MRQIVKLAFLLLFFASLAEAQTTVVSGTITDNGPAPATPYINGQLVISLINPTGGQPLFGGNANFQQVYFTGLDATGSFSVTLPANTSITPTGTQWGFTYASFRNYGGATVNITITGATQNVSSTLSGQTRISWPSGAQPPPGGSGQVIVALANGQSAWAPAGSGTGTVTHTNPLTANLPVIGNGAADLKIGSSTGNTTQFATWTGSTTAAKCVDTDASGNLEVTSSDCNAGAAPAFSAITPGTNTGALVIGTGGSLTVSGSGTNNATTLGGATFAAPGTIGGTTPAAGTFTTVTSAIQDKGGQLFNIKAYGAVCDGTTDDTAAIQTAVNAAVAAGGATYIPTGVCIVTPATHSTLVYAISVGAGTNITGVGTIKLVNSAGAYDGIFESTTNCTNCSFTNFTIDSNIANNAITAGMVSGNVLVRSREPLALVGANYILVSGMTFKNSSAQSEIAVNAGTGDIIITNNIMQNIGDDPNHNIHDVSSIYVSADQIVGDVSQIGGITVSGNIIEASSFGAPSAVTGIEMHGSRMSMSGNTIWGYATGATLTGVELQDSEAISASANSFTVGLEGISLWSVPLGAHTSGYGIHGCTITGNAITVHQVLYNTNASTTATQLGLVRGGIYLYSSSTLPVADLIIDSNTVVFDLEGSSITGASNEEGIGFTENVPTLTATNITITNNTIENFPESAIRWEGVWTNLTISGNNIINPGSSLYRGLASSAFYDIYLAALTATASNNTLVSNNTITDNLATSRILTAFNISCVAAAKNWQFLDNIVNVSDGTHTSWDGYYIVQGDNNCDPFVRMVVNVTSWLTPLGNMQAGSSVFDRTLATPGWLYFPADGTSFSSALNLIGATSGKATITAPAVAGTAANPVVFSNNISAPALVSTVAIGTAPFVVASTTNVPNLNASLAPTQSQNDNSTKISTTAYTDLAVSNALAGVNPAIAVLAASTSNQTGTYSNGVGGIGATFTITATGVYTLDGVTINTIGQRILLKNQASGFQNGMYTATIVGSVGVSPVFTRALDYDTSSDINNTGAIPVQSGTVNSTTSWLLTSTVNTVGTDALTYVKFSSNPSTIVSEVPVQLPVAVCQGSGVSIGGSGVAATLPAVVCNAGSTTVPQSGAQVYAQATLGTLYVDYNITLPSVFTSIDSIVFKVYNDTATTGTDYMNFQYKCVADGSTFGPTYAAVQQASGAVPGTINQFVTLTLTAPTITGCAAGNIMYIRIGAGTGAGVFASGNLDLALAKVELH